MVPGAIKEILAGNLRGKDEKGYSKRRRKKECNKKKEGHIVRKGQTESGRRWKHEVGRSVLIGGQPGHFSWDR